MKIKGFKLLHKNCGDDCTHLEHFYKKLFVGNEFNKNPRKYSNLYKLGM